MLFIERECQTNALSQNATMLELQLILCHSSNNYDDQLNHLSSSFNTCEIIAIDNQQSFISESQIVSQVAIFIDIIFSASDSQSDQISSVNDNFEYFLQCVVQIVLEQFQCQLYCQFTSSYAELKIAVYD